MFWLHSLDCNFKVILKRDYVNIGSVKIFFSSFTAVYLYFEIWNLGLLYHHFKFNIKKYCRCIKTTFQYSSQVFLFMIKIMFNKKNNLIFFRNSPWCPLCKEQPNYRRLQVKIIKYYLFVFFYFSVFWRFLFGIWCACKNSQNKLLKE